jgi:hypothetical protein
LPVSWLYHANGSWEHRVHLRCAVSTCSFNAGLDTCAKRKPQRRKRVVYVWDFCDSDSKCCPMCDLASMNVAKADWTQRLSFAVRVLADQVLVPEEEKGRRRQLTGCALRIESVSPLTLLKRPGGSIKYQFVHSALSLQHLPAIRTAVRKIFYALSAHSRRFDAPLTSPGY